MKKKLIILLLAIILVSTMACSGGNEKKSSKAGPMTIGDEIDLDKYLVKFTEIKSDKKDEKDVAHIYYDFTNNSGETISASKALRIDVFQNGVQQDVTYFFDDTGEDDREIKEVRDGVQ